MTIEFNIPSDHLMCSIQIARYSWYSMVMWYHCDTRLCRQTSVNQHHRRLLAAQLAIKLGIALIESDVLLLSWEQGVSYGSIQSIHLPLIGLIGLIGMWCQWFWWHTASVAAWFAFPRSPRKLTKHTGAPVRMVKPSMVNLQIRELRNQDRAWWILSQDYQVVPAACIFQLFAPSVPNSWWALIPCPALSHQGWR